MAIRSNGTRVLHGITGVEGSAALPSNSIESGKHVVGSTLMHGKEKKT